MPSYSKEFFALLHKCKDLSAVEKKSCDKADIKRLILKCRKSSSAYSTVLGELQDLSKDIFHKPVTYVLNVSARMFGTFCKLFLLFCAYFPRKHTSFFRSDDVLTQVEQNIEKMS